MDDKKPTKVLLLGSGALKIGQAGEFDYSGNQAIKALKDDNIEVILINPNVATVQTSKDRADKIYFLPITPYFVERVIEKEKPDGILLSFGGQTALNCGVELHDTGILKKHNVEVLGTGVDVIKNTEDRALFKQKLKEINVSTPISFAVTSVEEGMTASKKIKFPIMIRSAYALGGAGSGVAYDEDELQKMLLKGFSLTKQMLVEEYLEGWKEIEYEVVRDKNNNCITVCNMENFDPLGIHTGESIVIAPSQTLTNEQYHSLRDISIKTIRHLGIVGECNIQYALNPDSNDYRVIEVNARLSRSSALASKATGYPLAYVGAKLAIGKSLTDIKNSVTKSTTACFEPSLDYVVLKIPRWDLEKFTNVSKQINTEMKSVGEVMSIARNFNEALQKAIRMLDIGKSGAVCNDMKFKDLKEELKHPTDKRVFAIETAIEEGMSIDEIYNLTYIDKWFLYKIKDLVELKQKIKDSPINKDLLKTAKQQGFSDPQIAQLKDTTEKDIREQRISLGIVPYVKQIDTLAAEYPAKTNYLYLTYDASEHDIKYNRQKMPKAIVVGSGSYRIGSSVEFDWCCVSATQTLKNNNYETIMINCNPETVSTDYDECDKLYFDELSFERICDIYDLEKPEGIIVSVGGQIPNNLAMPFYKSGVKIFGTSPTDIDRAENRFRFSNLMDILEIKQPIWRQLTSLEDAIDFAKDIYPVLIRPSYVLSGAAMKVVFAEEELLKYLKKAASINKKYPVVVSRFVEDAKEVEMDAVANNGSIVCYAISEHIEEAGVHSGDSTMIQPTQNISGIEKNLMKNIAKKTASALNITGPFNIQFLITDTDIMVIECNLRASRSFPFISKVLDVNFIDLAVQAMIGKPIGSVEIKNPKYMGVKTSQFSYSRLKGADPFLSVEMASTGEVACLGRNLDDAFLKSVLSTNLEYPKKNILVSISGDKNRAKLTESLQKLQSKNYNLYATEDTAQFYKKHGINSTELYKIKEKTQPNIYNYMTEKKLDLIICIPRINEQNSNGDNYMLRRLAIDCSVPLINNIKIAEIFTEAIISRKLQNLEIKSLDEYTNS
ncbi:MAG: carbamoyl-phosphate synthase (glutamine-hydrolyzing) large subunit [Candidatus Aenigmarchaeota archaeon]|nr:carbamoyl-phosphate synthase (glutamine-hydrolyzing) large subunit [Candidatus Aenigmarchaeota archaeon]